MGRLLPVANELRQRNAPGLVQRVARFEFLEVEDENVRSCTSDLVAAESGASLRLGHDTRLGGDG